MGAPGPWTLYNTFKTALGNGGINFGSDTIMMALFTSASIAINTAVSPATYTAFAADGHEVSSTSTGYTTGGVAVAVTWTGASTLTLGAANASWTASTAGITARAAVLYDNTNGSKQAIAYMLLDATPADVTVASGNTLTINDSANIFTLT
jgi:hypothetical protein